MLRLWLGALVSLATSRALAQEVVLPLPPVPRVASFPEAEFPEADVELVAPEVPQPPYAEAHASVSFVVQAPVRFGHEVFAGFTNMDPAVDGHTFGIGWSVDFELAQWFALGLRVGWSMTPDLGLDADGDGRDDNSEPELHLLSISAGPRFRIPTAGEESNDAFVLEIGAGAAYIVDDRRPSGAILDLAVSRWGDLGGFGGGPIVRVQQGLGDAGSLTTVLVGLQGGLDLGERGREPEGESVFRYTLGWDAAGGGAIVPQGRLSYAYLVSVGMTFGIPIADVIEPRARVDFGYRFDEVRDPLALYGVSGGLRLLLDPWAPVYVEAGAGWAFRFGTLAADVPDGAFLDLGAGARFIDCENSHAAFTLGARVRIGLSQSDALTSIEALVGIEYDAVPPRHRPRCHAVQPTPDGPRTIEIPLGFALGPSFEIRLSPDMLPALDGAPVDVEIVGPPHALERAEIELRSLFDARGVSLGSVTRTARRNPMVSARITVR